MLDRFAYWMDSKKPLSGLCTLILMLSSAVAALALANASLGLLSFLGLFTVLTLGIKRHDHLMAQAVFTTIGFNYIYGQTYIRYESISRLYARSYYRMKGTSYSRGYRIRRGDNFYEAQGVYSIPRLAMVVF